MDENEKKPTLRNDKERWEYIVDPANWETVEASQAKAPGGQPAFRLERLKGTPFMRLVSQLAPKYSRYGNGIVDYFESFDSGCGGYVLEKVVMRVAVMARRIEELGI